MSIKIICITLSTICCNLYFFSFIGCVSGQTDKSIVEPTPPAKTSVNRSVEPSEDKGKRLKLSEQPLEIRLFFAPDYNLIEDEKTGAYPDKSPKWAEAIETKVLDIDLNHDGSPERMITFLTDPFGREINPETFDVYFFRLEKGKWKIMNRSPFNCPDQIKFITSQKQGDFDDIRYPDTRENSDKQADATEIKIISVNRFLNGEYQEAECRDFETDKIISDCPPSKTANDY